jgi:hypothetical protein
MDPHVAGKDLLHLQCHFGLDTLPRSSPTGKPEYAWQHSMGEIVTSLAAAGLRIEYLHEHDWVGWRMFSLKATKA